MRKHVHIILICCIVLGISTSSAKRIVLNGNNISDIQTENSCFVINELIDLTGQDLTVGKNSILQFRGGSFRNGKLNINGAMVDAAPYYIFDNTEFEGVFGNEEVQVKWFTSSVYSSGDSILSLALEMAPDNQVVLSGSVNYVNGTFKLNKRGQRFRVNGKLSRNDSADPLIEMSAPDLDVYVRRITRYDKYFKDNVVLHLCGNVENSRIDINDINGGNRGLAFSPILGDLSRSEQKVWNNKIRFAHISVQADPIYYDNVGTANTGYNLTVGGNFMLGGRLSGKSGVLQKYTGTQNYPYHANVYCGLIFERISDVCLQMRGSENEMFVYTRMNEEYPTDGKPFLDISDSRRSRIYTKGINNAGREIYPGTNVDNVDIEVFTNTGEWYAEAGLSRAIVTSPTADATGQASVFLTARDIPYDNRATTLNFVASSVARHDTIMVDDLFAQAASSALKTRFFNDFSVMTIGANRHVTLMPRGDSKPSEFKTVLLPMTIVLDLGDNASFTYNNTTYINKALQNEAQQDLVSCKSATLRFVWEPGWKSTLVRVH